MSKMKKLTRDEARTLRYALASGGVKEEAVAYFHQKHYQSMISRGLLTLEHGIYYASAEGCKAEDHYRMEQAERTEKALGKVTEADRKTLQAILEAGGLWEYQLHMGSLKTHGGARKTSVAQLVKKGWARWEKVEDPSRQKYRNPDRPWAVTTSLRVFATQAGREAITA